MKIAATIVTYNRKELLSKCLSALFEQKKYTFDIVIVDNNSSDGTGEYVDSLHNEKIIYYNTGANLGGAGGFSFALKKCVELGYDYCWIMDDDTFPQSDACQSLIDKILKIDASYICSRVQWTDGNSCAMNTPPISKRGCFYNNAALDLKLIEIQGCSFVSCMVNMKYVKLAGLPIADFFIYGDDVEFTRRLENYSKGYLDIESVVVHAMPNNNVANIVNCEDSRIERYRYGVRNNVYIQRKIEHLNFFQIMGQMLRTAIVILVKSKSKKMSRLGVVFSATFKGLVFNPNIEKV